jgi:uncharacterized protein with HEPN domain
MKRSTQEFLLDIDQNIERAIDFVKDLNFDQFCQDQKTLYAVVRAIEVIGEAVKNIPDEIYEQYPEVPWSSVAKMRDRLAHQYFGINDKVVWDTVKNDLPDLKPLIENILKNLGR